jgi:uncharacterized protein (TIRG00374 family)
LVRWKKFKHKFINNIFHHVIRVLASFKDGLLEIRQHKIVLPQTFLLTAAAWASYACSFTLILVAFGINLPYYVILIILCIAWTIGIFSFLPGGLGTRDFTFAVLLATIGVPFGIGTASALIDRIIGYSICGTGSLLASWSLSRKGKS